MEYRDDEPIIEEEEDNQRTKCSSKVGQILQEITIEPMMFFGIMAWAIQSSLGTNLLLTKVCREQQNDTEICANLTSRAEENAAAQKVVSTIKMYERLLTGIPTVIFILFLGSWSDKHGRKIPMILPLFGNFLSTLIIMINAYWIELPAMYILFASIPISLTGGTITYFMACYAYMSDMTRERTRTMRMAFLNLGFSLGSPLGFFLGGILFDRAGYLGNFGASALFFLIAIIYAIIRIEDTRGPFSKYNELVPLPRNMCSGLFDMKNVKDTVLVVKKLRPNKGRGKIILMMGTLCIFQIVFGSRNLDFLYIKLKFGWDYTEYTHLKVVGKLASLAAMAVFPPLLSYRLKVSDATLGIVACLSEIVHHILEGCAPYSWFFYLASVVSSVGGLALVVSRSIISKIVPRDELGKVFSMLAFWESILPLVSHPLYTAVYNATIEDYPGTIYFLSATFLGVTTVIFIWLLVEKKREIVSTQLHEEE
ncbi:solute carrier family 46 member 3-like [Homarus americanus]|nr:solute carrier family 46 member 3-like [Homarus americanus]